MKEEYKDFIKILTLLKTVKRGIDLTDVAVFPVHFLDCEKKQELRQFQSNDPLYPFANTIPFLEYKSRSIFSGPK